MRRCVLLLGLGLVLAGCYGQTDPATEVSQSGATLHGRGTTDDGPADVWFEYWPTAAIAQRKLTPERRIPGDVTAPLSERVSGLAPNTAYSFRLCGRDVGEEAACAQVRSFTTGQDFVRANGYGQYQIGIYALLDIEVFDGPQGAGPSGRAYGELVDPYPGYRIPFGSRTTPNTTCVAVRGKEAVVGFTTPNSTGPPGGPHFVQVWDLGPEGSFADRFEVWRSSDPPRAATDCSPLREVSDGIRVESGDIVVNDATP